MTELERQLAMLTKEKENLQAEGNEKESALLSFRDTSDKHIKELQGRLDEQMKEKGELREEMHK